MKMQMNKLILCLLLMVVLTSCSSAIQTVEVTRLVPKTIEVTSPIPQSTIAPESGDLIITPDVSVTPISITIQTDSFSVPMDPVYFDGFIVLTQYYTLLDQGAYEEAVSLYSSSILGRNGFEAEVEHFEYDLEAVNISFILPLNYWLAQRGRPMPSTPENEMHFVVDTTVFHKGAAWNEGGTPKPDNQVLFITLIQENGEWKIDEMNSYSTLAP